MKLQSNRHGRTLLGSLIVSSSLALAGAAYGQTTGQTNAPLGEMGANGAITPNRAELPDSAFSKLDTGSKGYLTRDDTRSLGGFDFNAHDLNHDGRLTADEFSQAWQRYSGNANPGASTGINGTGNATGGTGGMSGSTNGSTSGGAMAPRGGGVGATTRTNESSRTTTGTPMDSTSPAPASSGSTAK